MKENHSAEAVKIFTFTPVWLLSACVKSCEGVNSMVYFQSSYSVQIHNIFLFKKSEGVKGKKNISKEKSWKIRG
jgi:hypothetical protein